MQEVILLKYGELILKGLNRRTFESILFKNIRRALYKCGDCSVTQSQSTICIRPDGGSFDMARVLDRLQKVFGIVSIARACVVEKEMETIKKAAAEYLRDTLEDTKTFKVEAKRSDKRFPLTSPEIAADTGEALLNAYPHLSVDVHSPQTVVMVEIRDFGAYIHAGNLPGAGGMPAGSGGKVALLVSGGIDSPVAGYMMAKRGLSLCAVHFASPPYTSERAQNKVEELVRILSGYGGRIPLYVVPFTAIQENIRRQCPEDYFTLIMRRMMMKIAGSLAEKEGCRALITGESVGQVASQTLEAIACTEAAAALPVLRPLIGMDKEEIVRISRRIGTYETSILPYEDCCTVFTPRHPQTKPKLAKVEEAESLFDFAPLIEKAVADAERIVVG